MKYTEALSSLKIALYNHPNATGLIVGSLVAAATVYYATRKDAKASPKPVLPNPKGARKLRKSRAKKSRR